MLFALLLIGAGLGLRQAQNVDEERFLGVALEMLHNGSWLIPHRAGEIYGDKPPIFMWTVAFFVWLTGLPNIALYIPGLFSAATVTALVYDLGRRLWNPRIGRIAALLYLATYQTYSILRTGQIDSFLILFTTLGMYGLARHLLLGPAWRWFYVGCAAMGIGVITKGVGFLPALMLIPYAYAVRKGWPGVVAMPGETRKWLLGLLLMLAAIAIWLLPLAVSIVLDGAADEVAYAREILLRQTAGRYANCMASPRTVLVLLHQRHSAILAAVGAGPAMAGAGLASATAKTRRSGAGAARLGGAGRVVFLYQCRQTQVVYLPGAAGAGAGGGAVGALVAAALVQAATAISTGISGVGRDLVRAVVRPGVYRTGQGRRQSQSNAHGPGRHHHPRRGPGIGQLGEGHWLFARQPIVHFGMARLHRRKGRPVAARTPAGLRPGAGRSLGRCFKPEAARELGKTPGRNGRLSARMPITDNVTRALRPGYRFSWADSAGARDSGPGDSRRP